MTIVEQFRKEAGKIAIGLAVGAVAVGLAMSERAAVVLSLGAAAVAIFKLTDDYLKDRNEQNRPGRPIVRSAEELEIDANIARLRAELGIGAQKNNHG